MLNQINSVSVYSLLNSLNIKYQGIPNKKGWLDILCPNHNDNNFGNCSINVESGIISCFACGYTNHISNLTNNSNINISHNFEHKKVSEKIVIPKLSAKKEYNFIYADLNPEDFYYTQQRGFTKEFCKTFNFVRVFSFPYEDYFAFSIIDSKKEIFTVEFRKLKEYEYLCKYYNRKSSFAALKQRFKTECDINKIELTKDYILYKKGNIIYNDTIKYLLDHKVKYEPNSKLKETLWNIDNLDRSATLYVVEGIGSIPKIWSSISKNITCTFGSKVTQDQIDILKEFKEVVIIPDNDIAGIMMVNSIYQQINNIFVIGIKSEDTDADYIFQIKNTNKIEAYRWLATKMILESNQISESKVLF